MDVSSLIRRGSIFHSTEFDNIDHGKMFVVMGDNGEDLLGFFFINSKINTYIQCRERLLNMQLSIKQEDYPAILTHGSFLACHAITTISKLKLTDQLARKTAAYRGMLQEKDLNLVLDAARCSDLYSESEKETYFK